MSSSCKVNLLQQNKHFSSIQGLFTLQEKSYPIFLLHFWCNCILFLKISQSRSSCFEANIIIRAAFALWRGLCSGRRLSRTRTCPVVNQMSMKSSAAPRGSWFWKRVREERIKMHMGRTVDFGRELCCNKKNYAICHNWEGRHKWILQPLQACLSWRSSYEVRKHPSLQTFFQRYHQLTLPV